jgi:uncharacterized protein (TIGR00730 family)
MQSVQSVCVYCGSSPGADPRHAKNAYAFGKALAENGVRLVYGGGGLGLMGTVARGVLDHGGQVKGIIPQFLVDREAMLLEVQDHVVTNDMHERKRLMFEEADAFVALPGGIGTLEELVEQLTWSQLGQHAKPILLANFNDFWSPLLTLFDHMRSQAFIRQDLPIGYLVAERVQDILPMLEQAASRVDATPGLRPEGKEPEVIQNM